MNKNVGKTLVIHPHDNVAVLLDDDIKMGIQFGHKIALKRIRAGEHIIKYGHTIGIATSEIPAGEHVHVHNLKTGLSGIVNYEYNPTAVEFNFNGQINKQPDTFLGYRRPNGTVGIRNEIWIINTVGCVNKIAEKIVSSCKGVSNNIDGVFTFVHPYGCSQLGDDHNYTKNILANLARHPNTAGVLILGLGCENNNIEEFKDALGKLDEYDKKRIKFLNAQDVDDEISTGVQIIKELIKDFGYSKREPIPVSELVIGLKCGGSDGLSGITANPLVGNLSDTIIAKGGSCILTEVPEMFGAESLLMDRCVSQEVFNKTVNLINDFKGYFLRHGQEIYENPSPGNIDGGISTLEEKSLGCTQKGGQAPVSDVINYGETIENSGLNLLQGPGNDIVAVTNLAAAGAHMILFTTGRGTPLGGPVPTVKISSNTALAKSKHHWTDFDAGVMLNTTNPDEINSSFYDHIIEIASGKQTKNELNDYREIAIFKEGVTL